MTGLFATQGGSLADAWIAGWTSRSPEMEVRPMPIRNSSAHSPLPLLRALPALIWPPSAG